MYAVGEGISANDRAALTWLRKAAAQGMVKAQYALALMYELGRGDDTDYNAAARWYREAAEKGLAEAQENLGEMYARGKGVPRDSMMAFFWTSLAASQENARAGVILEELKQDLTSAQITKAEKAVENMKSCLREAASVCQAEPFPR